MIRLTGGRFDVSGAGIGVSGSSTGLTGLALERQVPVFELLVLAIVGPKSCWGRIRVGVGVTAGADVGAMEPTLV